MNPLKALIETLVNLQAELRKRFNAAVRNVGELEKIEASQPVVSAIRDLDWARERLEDIDRELAGRLAEVDAEIGRIGSAAVTAAIAAGSVVKKEDHDTQITAARNQGRQDAKVEFDAERRKDAEAITRREALAKEIGTVAAAAIGRDDLIAEDHQARIDTLKARAAKLAGLGITPTDHAAAYCDLLACPLDEGGTKVFDGRIMGYEAVLGGRKPGVPEGEGKPDKPEAFDGFQRPARSRQTPVAASG